MHKTEYVAYLYPGLPVSRNDIPRRITGTSKHELILRARSEECCLFFELYAEDVHLESHQLQPTGNWRIERA